MADPHQVPQHVRKFVFRSPPSSSASSSSSSSSSSGKRSSSSESLEVFIPEVVSRSYGLYTWPCAPVLAQYVWHHRHSFADLAVLEIGAGTALPGIVAAKCGARVTLSDSGRLAEVLRGCRASCRANGLAGTVPVVGVTWGLFTPDLLRLGPVDVVLGSDCLYDPAVFEDVLVTVSYLLERSPSARFVCSYQERASDWSLEHLLHKWRLTCEQVPLASFGADTPSVAGSNLPGSHAIHVFQIARSPGG